MSYLVTLQHWNGDKIAEVSFDTVPMVDDLIEIETLQLGEENAHIDKGPVKEYKVTGRKWLTCSTKHYTTGVKRPVLTVQELTPQPDIPWG
jgi:hypothetical protein